MQAAGTDSAIHVRSALIYNCRRAITLSDDERKEILGEVLHDELKAIFEAVSGLQETVAVLPQIQADIADLKQDMKMVKAAVTDLSREHRGFDRRLSQLEST